MTELDETLKRLREIRSMENVSLKPSPYLKNSYTDEYGEEHQITIRNYQKIGILNLLMMPRFLEGDDVGLGKAQPTDSLVLTPTGWVQIGDIKIGDEVIGSNGKPTKVLGVYPQGMKQVFRVTMSDGSSTECCEEHLWAVRTSNSKRFGNGWHVRSLKQIAAAGIHRPGKPTCLIWEIPVVQPVQFAEAQLPVDPYLLGVLLGDGCIVSRVNVTNGDPHMFDIIENHIPPDCMLGQIKEDGITKSIIGRTPGYNSLIRALKGLGLMGSNWHTKSIPEAYLLASVEQRAELLRGFMDTDGYVSKDGKITQFYSSNGLLVRDFVKLVQSLGGIARVASKTPILRGKSRAKNGRTAFIVTLSLPNWLIPFKLPRKVKRWSPRTKYLPSRRIEEITESRVTECVCIKVEASDSLYVTEDFIVTHNTIQVLSSIAFVFMKEPEYIPIVLTTKSALFQWKNECFKFTNGITPIVVHGEPYDRLKCYDEFFANDGRKKILLITYDSLFRDIDTSVIKDRGVKADSATKKALKKARETEKELKELTESLVGSLKERTNTGTYEDSDYAFSRMNGKDSKRPSSWNDEDEKLLNEAIEARIKLADARSETAKLNAIVSPSITVPGILDRFNESVKSGSKVMLVMDEAHKVKNYRSQVHEKVKLVSSISERVVAMTATPVKNRLMEFFGIFRIVNPTLFPKVTKFQDEFCVTKLQRVAGGRQVPIVVGYKHLDEFVKRIEPYYISRKKHEVAKELPDLISVEVQCELSDVQDDLYDMAENLVNENDSDEESYADILSSLTMCQQAVNAPQLIMDDEGNPFQGDSSKVDALLELLEGDASGKKVIVFSRFEKMISHIEEALNKAEIKCVRITGKENNPKVRQEAREKFQDLNSGIDVILITTAGSESLNLQAAEHFVFIDLPFSYGDYQQLIGRMIRIGSTHSTVIAHHFIGVRKSGEKTIDSHVLGILRSKKKLVDKVAGDGLVGGLQLETKDVVNDVLSAIRSGKNKNVKSVSVSKPRNTTKKSQILDEDETPIVVPSINLSDLI